MPLVAATRERGPEFAIVITNEIFRRLPIGGGFSQLLRHPGISRRARHAHMDHPSRFQFYYEEGLRAAERTGQLPARSHRPRYSPRDCGGTCTTFDLVAPGCVPSSCTSEWFAYTRVSPISTVPRACAQLPVAHCSSPSLRSSESFPRRPSAGGRRPLISASNTGGRAPDATGAGYLAER